MENVSLLQELSTYNNKCIVLVNNLISKGLISQKYSTTGRGRVGTSQAREILNKCKGAKVDDGIITRKDIDSEDVNTLLSSMKKLHIVLENKYNTLNKDDSYLYILELERLVPRIQNYFELLYDNKILYYKAKLSGKGKGDIIKSAIEIRNEVIGKLEDDGIKRYGNSRNYTDLSLLGLDSSIFTMNDTIEDVVKDTKIIHEIVKVLYRKIKK